MITRLFSSADRADGRGIIQWLRVSFKRFAPTSPKDVLPAPPSLALTAHVTGDRDYLRRLAGSKEAALELAREHLKTLECTCKDEPQLVCPGCSGPLQLAQPTASMSPQEFEAGKAGDYFCAACQGGEANSGYRYFWSRDLPTTKVICQRCMTLEITAVPGCVLAVLENEWAAAGIFWRHAAETAYREVSQAASAIALGERFCYHVAAIKWSPHEPNTQEWLEQLWHLGLAFQRACDASKAQQVWDSRPPDVLRDQEGPAA